MSLDVYLEIEGNKDVQPLDGGEHILIRDNGQTKEVSREEWDKLYPGREPVTVTFPDGTDTVFDYNITHNLNRMADVAGLYEALWRPEEIDISYAKQLIPILTAGLEQLRADPEKFRKYNPENGWGSYEGLVDCVVKYLDACQEWPEARVRVSR